MHNDILFHDKWIYSRVDGGISLQISVIDLFSSLAFLPCGHLLGKGWPLGSLVCDVFLCFCHFPCRCGT